MAKTNNIRVRLKAYDHKILDLSVQKIIEAATKTGATVVGPEAGLHNLTFTICPQGFT